MRTKLAVALLAIVGITACSDRDADSTQLAEEATRETGSVSTPPPADLGEAIERVGDAIVNGEKSVPAADLKALLPESMIGLDRVSHEAQRAGVGFTVSKAEARYGEADKQLSLLITDLGAASSLAAMSRNMFQNEIDSEDANGFERTTEYAGHQSYQRLIRNGDQSLAEVMVFVADRFTVQLDGQNVGWDDMMAAMEEIDIRALAAMARSGR